MRSKTILLFCTAVLVSRISATPIYYTFEGVVTSSNSPERQVGQAVRYVMMADLDEPGFLLTSGIASYPWTDFTDAKGAADYFRSEYVGGDALPTDIPTDWNPGLSYHIGLNDNRGPFNHLVQLNGSNQDQSGFDLISVFQPIHTIDEFFIGMDDNRFYNAVTNGTFVYEVYSQAVLVGISPASPIGTVPEPGSIVLFGLGLLLSGTFARKSR